MKKFLLSALAVAAITACEKPLLPVDNEDDGHEPNANIVIHFNVGSATRSDVTDACTRLNVAILRDGEKIKSVSQKAGDANFGTISLSLPDGDYDVVAVGHSSNGSATISTAEKVTFPQNRVSDTFSYYGSVTAGGSVVSESRSMQRDVAAVEFTAADLPTGTSELTFHYLGGSSTLSPKIHAGVVNSRQTEYRDVSDDGHYTIYTFPHTTDDVLTKVVVTAINADGTTLGETTIANIPITRNKLTRVSGSLFGSGSGATGGFSFSVNDDWDGVIDYQFADAGVPVAFSLSAGEWQPTRSTALSASTMTDVWLLDYQDGQHVQTVHLTSADEGFSRPSATLTLGAHRLYFVASQGSEPTLDTAAGTITWAVSRDTFLGTADLTVDGRSLPTQQVTLQRVATRLRLLVSDEVPDGLCQLVVTPHTWYYGINYLTGKPCDAHADEPRAVNVPASYAGTSGRLAMSVFGLSGTDEWTTDLTLRAVGEGDLTLGEVSITSAPFRRNVTTEYSGRLFSGSTAASLTLDDEWQDSDVHAW